MDPYFTAVVVGMFMLMSSFPLIIQFSFTHGFSARCLFHVSVLVSRIWWWLLDFWKICGPLLYCSSGGDVHVDAFVSPNYTVLFYSEYVLLYFELKYYARHFNWVSHI